MANRKGNQGLVAFHPERVARAIDSAKAENARRVKCRHCELMIIDMPKHLRICHPKNGA